MTRGHLGRPWAALAALALLVAALAVPALAQRGRSLPGLNGGQLSESDLARGATVLVVWASWSPRCRDVVERTNRIASGWGGRARVATVNFQEEPEAVQSFLAGKRLAVPVYLDRDGEFSKAHAVTALPGLLVFRDGEVVFAGRLPSDPDALLHQKLD
jgi:thiol-disulfide isomerase/thioredoxin